MSSKMPLVIGGKLKLKGSGGGPKVKKQRSEDSSGNVPVPERPAESLPVPAHVAPLKSAAGPGSSLTEAQRKHLEKKLKLDLDAAKKDKKTYRDRIDDFNQLLASTTEHNDIPRTSAAGNG